MPEPAPLGEFDRIRRHFRPLTANSPGALDLTDDAALLAPSAGHELVVTVDALVESVHFRPEDPPDLVARKMLRVNLSDLAAMGARPLGYVMTTALPLRCGEDWLAAFAAGLATDQAEFAVGLLGGDSVATPGPITLSLTAFGEVPAGAAIRRNGARAGDTVFVTGTIGDGALGLLAPTGRLDFLDEEHRRFLADRYLLPRPRCAVGPALRGIAHAMLDVSDGLLGDLGHITEGSGAAAEIDRDRVPLSPAAGAAVAHDPALWDVVLGGGDDYELLFTASGPVPPMIAGVPVTSIGRVVAGSGVRVLDGSGRSLTVAASGYRHF
ncbi:thiamine-phosphate kinase [Stella humosa]|uniref:Thiamine-monophosphate kinase n=1 Tax=Stella humosa TaxID=94 RepID=A0A3N1MCK3_9PROT|nr:thiamine-phosphate kinase [Stella humosa]ROQ01443.1 thiamine-phosphate kinase [Stella humosa]BBK31819.1 thiamine-monophosphate kinase [Stella humosa]